MTLGENLADNGGVRAALMAMRKSLEQNPEENLALPQLDHLSPEQLFFINFGRIWCSSMRPEMAVQRVRNDVHSPSHVRVNAAVQNSPEFAEAFKCAAQEPKAMDPAEKCQIW
jgi:predicted metalloendopeptidase